MVRAPIFEYAERFSLPATPDAVWSTVARTEEFESWWSWLRELRVDGTPLESGCVLHGLVAPPVPYRMHLHIALVRCVRPSLIEAAVSGDLVGRAGIRFDPERDGTRATVSWSVEMMQRPMRLAARVGSPVIRFAHDRVVEHTVSRFRHLLVQDPPRPNGRIAAGPAAEGGTVQGLPRPNGRIAAGPAAEGGTVQGGTVQDPPRDQVTLTRLRVVNEQR